MKIHDPCDAIIEARDTQEFSDGIRAVAEHHGFPLFAMLLACSRSGSPPTQWTFANLPECHVDAFYDSRGGRRDPVLKNLWATTAPFIYDRAFYEKGGAGDLWEMQAPYGYRTGIAAAVQLPAGRRVLWFRSPRSNTGQRPIHKSAIGATLHAGDARSPICRAFAGE